jgi:hypothetical protein
MGYFAVRRPQGQTPNRQLLACVLRVTSRNGMVLAELSPCLKESDEKDV